MKQSILTYIEEKPLHFLLLIGLFVRLIAAFSSHGYYAYDDYYKVVDIAWGWTMGENTDNWFVTNYADNDSLRSVVYPGIVAGMLLFSKLIGITDPFYQMIVVQLFHALYSLLIIFYVYKITLQLSIPKNAFLAGLLAAILWFFPFMSVRTLSEWICIPPFLAAFYLYHKQIDKPKTSISISIGLLLAVAFTFRFQIAFLIIGFGIGLIVRKEWKLILVSAFSFIALTCLVQGLGDYYVCNMPFGKLIEYINYNLEHSGDYLSRPFFDYILICPGLLLPPVGLFLFIGSFKNRKQYLPIFLSMLVFLVFHSLFENKQERFIFPILPLFLILGTIGMNDFLESDYWMKRKRLVNGFWAFFWVLNSVLLFFMCTNYTKESRIETLRFLRTQPEIQTLVIENTERGKCNSLPEFYYGKRLEILKIGDPKDVSSLSNLKEKPRFIIFEVKPNQTIETIRIEEMKKTFPTLKYIKRIQGGWVDNFRFKINPIVNNYEYEIFSTN